MDQADRHALHDAIQAYDFPAVAYDFHHGAEQRHSSMRQTEATIREQLTSSDLEGVRDGLSNVLYWGYARMGIRDVRVKRFRDSVTDSHLSGARGLFRSPGSSHVVRIKKLGLPQFSQLSFISKVRMFLEPDRYVTLDRKLAKIQDEPISTVLHDLTLYPTSIPVTNHNAAVYERWCRVCRSAARTLGGGTRAVDVERGIFHIVDTEGAARAAEIVSTIEAP